jgi:hypothetical protein
MAKRHILSKEDQITEVYSTTKKKKIRIKRSYRFYRLNTAYSSNKCTTTRRRHVSVYLSGVKHSEGYPISRHPEFSSNWQKFSRKFTIFMKLFKREFIK